MTHHNPHPAYIAAGKRNIAQTTRSAARLKWLDTPPWHMRKAFPTWVVITLALWGIVGWIVAGVS